MIHILGLSIGISAALVIFLIVYYEGSFDRFEPGKDRIYRVVLDASFNGSQGRSAAVPAPLGSAMQNKVTGLELTVPVFQFQDDASAKVSVVGNNPEKPVVYKKQKEIVFTNGQYFELLDYKWLAGSPKTSMENPFSIVLTESRAYQYFPSIPLDDIAGKQVTYNDDLLTTISGIVEDLHENTAFTSVEFISLSTIFNTNLQDRFMMTVWNDWMAYSQLFVKLTKGSNKLAVEDQVKKMFKKYNPDNNPSNSITFHLQPLNEMHFDANYPGVGQRRRQN
ncbi:MAG: ABC transporter permease [Chitinophagaceae bacterium]